MILGRGRWEITIILIVISREFVNCFKIVGVPDDHDDRGFEAVLLKLRE